MKVRKLSTVAVVAGALAVGVVGPAAAAADAPAAAAASLVASKAATAPPACNGVDQKRTRFTLGLTRVERWTEWRQVASTWVFRYTVVEHGPFGIPVKVTDVQGSCRAA